MRENLLIQASVKMSIFFLGIPRSKRDTSGPNLKHKHNITNPIVSWRYSLETPIVNKL